MKKLLILSLLVLLPISGIFAETSFGTMDIGVMINPDPYSEKPNFSVYQELDARRVILSKFFIGIGYYFNIPVYPTLGGNLFYTASGNANFNIGYLIYNDLEIGFQETICANTDIINILSNNKISHYEKVFIRMSSKR